MLNFAYVLEVMSKDKVSCQNLEISINSQAELTYYNYKNPTALLTTVVRKQCIMVLDFAC